MIDRSSDVEHFTHEKLVAALANVSGQLRLLSIDLERRSRETAEFAATLLKQYESDQAPSDQQYAEALAIGALFNEGGTPNYDFAEIEHETGRVWLAAMCLKGELIATNGSYLSPNEAARGAKQ